MLSAPRHSRGSSPKSEMTLAYLKQRSNINPETGCWIWRLSQDEDGYGRVGWRDTGRQRTSRSHIVAYKLLKGEVPVGHELHHRCANKSCCNPEHLEPQTPKDHGRLHWPTHCAHGHEFSPENTIWRKEGGRKCRTCDRAQSLARYHQKNYLSRRQAIRATQPKIK
jgi:HNH endonuclease